MRFELTSDQRDFMSTLDGLIASSDPVAVNRAWSVGQTEPGFDLWKRIADMGVPALLVPESEGGLDASPVELACAFEVLGRHAVPGPWIESAAFLAVALDGKDRQEIVEGTMASLAVPPLVPYAVDAAEAQRRYVVVDGRLHRGEVKDVVTSIDASRRLARVEPAPDGLMSARVHDDRAPMPKTGVERPLEGAFVMAVLATSAELLGAAERVLDDSVTYVQQRTQFGRSIGSYQAIKHQLADVRIALDFARPLVYGAAVDPTLRAVSAAKIQCAEAAHLAARVGLQVHGAIGYTAEYDLSRWLLRIRALISAWGTPAYHRETLLAELLDSR
ncbi:acyl-CoA dehydrogenase family protein [Aeromicrobium terrae]|uniref:Acyl-CoA dehydrogenase n=1 Tax=Aeromicrobium terrae TaxID=2498846 RepID=A0A5C8NI58_9ACTN|nr:acyl-CoA dehydrogenase family protein [Aeromicrobium terrae]TXL60840.1 acyl-CoA dehydrogenase [Aeromicrobium terrae]